MNTRRSRILRIVDHRKKELDDVGKELLRAQARLAAAVKDAEAADARLHEAEQARRELGRGNCDVRSFIEAEEWLLTQVQYRTRAWAKVAAVRTEAAAIEQRVLAARMKVRQAEKLLSRIDDAEKIGAERRE